MDRIGTNEIPVPDFLLHIIENLPDKGILNRDLPKIQPRVY